MLTGDTHANFIENRRCERVRVGKHGIPVLVIVQALAYIGIGQSAGNTVVVEVLVIGESSGERILVAKTMIALGSPLPHLPVLPDLANPVVAVRKCVARSAVRQRVKLQHLHRDRVESIGRNDIAVEGSSNKARAVWISHRSVRIVDSD